MTRLPPSILAADTHRSHRCAVLMSDYRLPTEPHLGTARRLQDGRQSETIRGASSDFEARRLLRQSARHRQERAPGPGPMLVPLLQRYQAYPLSKPGIDLCTLDFLSRSVRYQSISHRTDRMALSSPN